MKPHITLIGAAGFAALMATTRSQSVEPLISSLIESEKAFAAMSVQEGMKKAFLTFLSDDAILFRPGPVIGKEVWKKKSETSAQLDWRPTLAFVAASGELGYTSGPWIYTPEAHLDQPPQYGYFFSVWRKQRDGWKVVLDLGVTTGIPSDDSVLVVPAAVQSSSRKLPNATREKKRVLKAEEKFSALGHVSGLRLAYKEFLSDDARIYREGIPPLSGRDSILTYFAGTRTRMKSTAQKCVLSKSCDLAYTYGEYSSAQDNADESGYFVRIWRKNAASEWKLAIEVLSPRSNED